MEAFVCNGWFERCKPAFLSNQDRIDWEKMRPAGYVLPEEDIPVCYNSVMIYGVRKKLVLLFRAVCVSNIVRYGVASLRICRCYFG